MRSRRSQQSWARWDVAGVQVSSPSSLQNEGGQRTSVRECGPHAAAEELQMRPTGGGLQVFQRRGVLWDCDSQCS